MWPVCHNPAKVTGAHSLQLVWCHQVHVKLAGSSRVLINTHNLPGLNAKALELSSREQNERCATRAAIMRQPH